MRFCRGIFHLFILMFAFYFGVVDSIPSHTHISHSVWYSQVDDVNCYSTSFSLSPSLHMASVNASFSIHFPPFASSTLLHSPELIYPIRSLTSKCESNCVFATLPHTVSYVCVCVHMLNALACRQPINCWLPLAADCMLLQQWFLSNVNEHFTHDGNVLIQINFFRSQFSSQIAP